VALLKWGHQPGYFDRKPAIASYFNRHHNDIVLATYLDMLAGFFLLWFFAVLRGRLRSRAGDNGRWSDLALAGGVAAVAVTWVADALIYAGAERAAQPGPITPASAATLFDTSTTLMRPAAIGLAVALSATAVVAIQFRALPRWLAWSAATASPTACARWARAGAWSSSASPAGRSPRSGSTACSSTTSRWSAPAGAPT